MENARVKKK